jgi:type I restriction enzyme S subunit
MTVGIVVTPAKYYEESGVPCLRSLNVAKGSINLDDLVYISPESNDLHSKSKLHARDLVLVRTGLTGTAAVVPPTLDGANCIDLLIVRRSSSMQSRLLWYYINSLAAKSQVEEWSEEAIQAHYNTSTLATLRVVLPPGPEQEAVVEFLDRETAELDALVAKVRTAIALLREYRTAIISAAVTGKIDVRGEVV